MDLQVSGLRIYPIKSIAGNFVESATVEARGLVGDRRWMLVDDEGRFITQREHGALALISAQPAGQGVDCWMVGAPGQPALPLTPAQATADTVLVRIWSDTVTARLAESGINEWFSRYLGFSVRAVYMDAQICRPVEPEYAQADDTVSFADGYPLLLTNTASLAELNGRLSRQIDMRRFRPNVLISGAEAFAEDHWRRIVIGDIEFDVAKACSRCVLTTRDPDTGELDPNRDPLRTLSSYRRAPGGVMFGQNLIPRGVGMLSVGMPIRVLDYI